MTTKIVTSALGEEQKGCVVGVSDGTDKLGIPLRQAVLTHGLGLLLLSKEHSHYRAKPGKSKPKSDRVYIMCVNFSSPTWVITKLGVKDIHRLNDSTEAHRLGAKETISTVFSLAIDDVWQCVVKT